MNLQYAFALGCLAAGCIVGDDTDHLDDEFRLAARRPAQFYADGALFYIPEDKCMEGAAMWNAAVKVFGQPQGGMWSVYGRARDWAEFRVGKGFVEVAGTVGRWTHSITLNVVTRPWCDGYLLFAYRMAMKYSGYKEEISDEALEAIRASVCEGKEP